MATGTWIKLNMRVLCSVHTMPAQGLMYSNKGAMHVKLFPKKTAWVTESLNISVGEFLQGLHTAGPTATPL